MESAELASELEQASTRQDWVASVARFFRAPALA
jgi:hypothetical protein